MGRPTTGGGAGSVVRSAAVILVLVVVMTTAMAPSVVRAVTCGQVLGYMTPCVSYAMGPGTSNPPEACCSGVRSLNAAANNTAERQATCKCLKKITATMPLLNPDTVAGIPSKCGVDIPYPIRSSTDCSKVQ